MGSIVMMRDDVLPANGAGLSPNAAPQVRKGRSLKTEVVNNSVNPTFDSLFRFVIDDPGTQRIRMLVKDSDWLADSVVGYAEIPIKVAPLVYWSMCTHHGTFSWQHTTGCTHAQPHSYICVECVCQVFGEEHVPVVHNTYVNTHALTTCPGRTVFQRAAHQLPLQSWPQNRAKEKGPAI